MQLDTETASAILKSSAQCNAVAAEATSRIVELMQEGLAYRERIAELEAQLDIAKTAAEFATAGLEAARQRIAELEAALREIAEHPHNHVSRDREYYRDDDDYTMAIGIEFGHKECAEIARKALEGKKR